MRPLWNRIAGHWVAAPDIHERAAVELIIARMRVVVAVSALAAVHLAPHDPPAFGGMVDALLAAYAVYSIGFAGYVRARRDTARLWGGAVQGIDLAWATAFTSLTGGPSSHFSPPVFVFVILGVAYRWGILETIAAGVVSALLVLAQAAAASLGYLGVRVSMGDVTMRSVWLLLVGALLGQLAEWNRGLRAEAAFLSRVTRNARVQAGLGASVKGVLRDLHVAFAAKQVLFITEEESSGRLFYWSSPDSGGGSAAAIELDRSRRDDYLFPVPSEVEALSAVRKASDPEGRPARIRALDSRGNSVAGGASIPNRLADGVPWRTLCAVSVEAAKGWRARLLLIDPAGDAVGERKLRFLQTVVRQVGPALVNIYLVRRLRARVEEAERARVGRELHDGLVQTLIGLDIELEIAIQETRQSPSAALPALRRAQQMFRDQIVEVRSLMRRMRPLTIDGRSLVPAMDDAVAAFRRNSGVQARFTSEADEVDLRPRICRELVRIVEEALVNARKHSQATDVAVTLSRLDGCWRLVIGDNGQGFDFAGRLSLEELNAAHAGPAVIKERVEAIDGQLWVQSEPGVGSQLDIRIKVQSDD